MNGELQILGSEGHLTLRWSADDPASIEKARVEFDRLRAAGFALFTSDEPEAPQVTRLKAKALVGSSGELHVRIAREFNPRATRTVAVRPMRGG